MNPIVVRWYPPYSNNSKDRPVRALNEARIMVDWFRSIQVQAEIIYLEVTEIKDEY